MNKPLRYGLFLILSATLINFITFSIISLFSKNYLVFLVGALLSGIIISIIIIFSTPVLKDFLATYRIMMRLENLSHPLLLDLSLKAPGTYNHSLTVANLANRAAKSIGANSISTRIGGYYHDIGKSQNSEFFIENQSVGENPHAVLNNPNESAKIIMEHVSNGVRLAEENHFPKEIIDLIEQHHGTTIVSFFYAQAKDKNYKTKREEFRYPGPKPLTPEAAILMLSDAIEAKTRLSKEITPLVIRETVDEIISSKIKEKQLDLSNMDENKIERIRSSFIETLSTMYHQRIKYPSQK